VKNMLSAVVPLVMMIAAAIFFPSLLSAFNGGDEAHGCMAEGIKHTQIIPGDRKFSRSTEISVLACQARCAANEGCAYFSFWTADGSCDLVDAASEVISEKGWVAGPRLCGEHVCFLASLFCTETLR
jgi:hypothetical protein